MMTFMHNGPCYTSLLVQGLLIESIESFPNISLLYFLNNLIKVKYQLNMPLLSILFWRQFRRE